MADRRHFITIQQGVHILYLASNRSRAHSKLHDLLVAKGIDPTDCQICATNLTERGSIRKLRYAGLRDLLNLANPMNYEGIDVMHEGETLFRLQRHHANGGE